jgi:hypothetical protein
VNLQHQRDAARRAALQAEWEEFLAAGGGVLPKPLHNGLIGGHLELSHQWYMRPAGDSAGTIYVSRR